MMEGFCEDCARHRGQWFDGRFMFIDCAVRGIVKRCEIKARCDAWLARTMVSRESIDKSQGNLFQG